LKIKNDTYNVDNDNKERALSTFLLTESELFQLSATDNDSDIRYCKSDLHKQNVRVCFFSEQKCTQPFSFKFFSSPFLLDLVLGCFFFVR
jgi:hypothetical protein